jgi:hypothetical protein
MGDTLILPIKKKWFDMELSGEKTEEYREIKPYWISRILKWLGCQKSEEKAVMQMLREQGTLKPREVLFRNGYSSESPSFTAMCTLKIGGGYEEWGAVKGEEYFVFTIHWIYQNMEKKKTDEIIQKIEQRISDIKDQLIYTFDEDMAVRLRCKMHGLDEALEIVKSATGTEKRNNDLISRSALMQALRGNVLIDVVPDLEQAIAEQPAAYDVEVCAAVCREEARGGGNDGI